MSLEYKNEIVTRTIAQMFKHEPYKSEGFDGTMPELYSALEYFRAKDDEKFLFYYPDNPISLGMILHGIISNLNNTERIQVKKYVKWNNNLKKNERRMFFRHIESVQV